MNLSLQNSLHSLMKCFFLAILMLFTYFILRIEFLAWNWQHFSEQSSIDIIKAILIGFRIDLSAICCLLIASFILAILPWPLRWQNKITLLAWFVFCIINIPFLIINMVDIEFVNFVGQRSLFNNLFIFQEASGKLLNFLSHYWPIILFNIILILFFIAVSYFFITKNHPFKKISFKKLLFNYGFTCLISIAFLVIGIRGGLQYKPIDFIHTNSFSAAFLNLLSSNSTFTLQHSYMEENDREVKINNFYNNQDEYLPLMNGSLKKSLLQNRPLAAQNIVVIVLESFALEYTLKDDTKTYTPFLNALSQQSLSFYNAYANSHRSINGITAVLGGIPTIMTRALTESHFANDTILGLGTLLDQRKYSTSFFHGGYNGTMHFDQFMKKMGIQNYFGFDEYNNPKEDDHAWGAWDEPFLQWMLSKLSQQKQPFMSSVFTLSSHDPFKIPPQYADKFPKGQIEILQAVAYSDYALERFFKEAAKQEWYKNTLFLITADHASYHYRKDFFNDLGDYRIPILLFHPEYTLPKIDPYTVAQQIDIIPTVVDFLNIKNLPQNYLGSSLFAPGDKVVVNYSAGRYLLMARDFYLIWPQDFQTDPIMYDIKDVDAKRPLSEPTKRKEFLTKKLKATIQYYNTGLLENKFYY